MLTSLATAVGRRVGWLSALFTSRWRRSPRVIVIEGNPDVAYVLTTHLRTAGYRVEQRESLGAEKASVPPAAAAVLSIGLTPEMARNLTWYRELRAARLDLPLLLIASSAPETLRAEVGRDERVSLLLHPVDPETYLDAIAALAVRRR